MGCGGGRHAFEAMRRGATVVALDYDARELDATCGRSWARCSTPASSPASPGGGAVNGDALALPFPDGTFDRIIASEVLEHIWADELRDLASWCACCGRAAASR